jgi:hypothetical protein
MGDVEELIERRRDESIIGHEFMQRLDGVGDMAALRRLLPRLGFFTFAFQDMLKLAREACSDPELTPLVRSLELGDVGHDNWYVLDLEDLGIRPSAHELFGAEYEVGRRVAYELIACILRVGSDHARLALLLTLEAAAREFFIRVPGFAARSGLERELRYFGRTHLEAEEAHDVFTEPAQQILTNIIVPAMFAAEVLETVDKTVEQMLRLAADLAAAMAGRNTPEVSHLAR